MSWTFACRELTLEELLDDPITVAVMRRDGIDRRQFEALVRRVSLAAPDRRRRPSNADAELPCPAE